MAIARFASFASAGALAGALLVAPPAHANGCIFANFGGGTGTSSDPLLVATADHLDELKDDSNCWGYEFLQTANISTGGATWSSGIGDSGTAFSGTYDGGGFTISDLTVSNASGNNMGLFGTVGSAGTIRNLGFSGSVSGDSQIGGLVGENQGAIENSFVSGAGSIASTFIYAGGLVGYNNGGAVSNSYARAPVSTANGWSGGLVGISSGGTVTNSFATGQVTGPDAGGLVGRQSSGSATASFWDTQTSGASTSFAGVGKTTAEMQNLSTFSSWSIASGWDATATWGICSSVNSGYPFLTAFYSSDPCTGTSPSLAGSSPARYQFTFALPDGRECTAISPVTVTAGSSYALPGEDASCAVEGSAVTGWRIPGQSAAFAPGRPVDVSGSQHFTAVLEYSWVNVIFDANVAMSNECLADGSNRSPRETTWSVPRELLLTGTVPVATSSPCVPPNHTLAGWSTAPAGERTALEFVPVPAVDSDGNAANDVRLYAIWAAN